MGKAAPEAEDDSQGRTQSFQPLTFSLTERNCTAVLKERPCAVPQNLLQGCDNSPVVTHLVSLYKGSNPSLCNPRAQTQAYPTQELKPKLTKFQSLNILKLIYCSGGVEQHWPWGMQGLSESTCKVNP